MIHILDATQAKVQGALVTAEWTLPDGTVFKETAATASQGVGRFSVWEGRGVYKLCVIPATKEGGLYDPNLDRESFPVITVP
jgi:hypothetical protein